MSKGGRRLSVLMIKVGDWWVVLHFVRFDGRAEPDTDQELGMRIDEDGVKDSLHENPGAYFQPIGNFYNGFIRFPAGFWLFLCQFPAMVGDIYPVIHGPGH